MAKIAEAEPGPQPIPDSKQVREMQDAGVHSDASGLVRRLTGIYQSFLGGLFTLTPLLAILYIELVREAAPRFEAYLTHEIAVFVATTVGAFVTYVTWRCYAATGEVFLRWLTLGFLGFTLVYLPHGLLTRWSGNNLELFLAFGPASRLIMAVCLIAAVRHYGLPPDSVDERRRPQPWLIAVGILLCIDVALIVVSLTPPAIAIGTLRGIETTTLLLFLYGIVTIAVRRIHMPLMTVYMISLAFFAQAGLAFLFSSPWSHLWWLAHGVFAAGFLIISYGVMQAFHTTRSFSTVYSGAQVMQKLRDEQGRALDAFEQLEQANALLSQLVSEDSLTGVASRRRFMEQFKVEIARSQRKDTPLALLCLDLDHFKKINDCHGHPVGDEVLKQAAAEISANLRPEDLLGRVGGEEFWILLPEAAHAHSRVVAERIRSALETLKMPTEAGVVQVTTSISCAQLGLDGNDRETLIRIGDRRLYEAKEMGRNCVVAGQDRK